MEQTPRRATRRYLPGRVSTPASLHYERFRLRHSRGTYPVQKIAFREGPHRRVREIRDFIARATAGDEDTLSCVGLNFPRELRSAYRATLVQLIAPWTEWALATVRRQTKDGAADLTPVSLPTEVYALRLGDAAIVGLQGEPFMDIGKQIKSASPFPLTVPCGYANRSYGYIPDEANTGDREYMSAFYRYSRSRPPFRKPGGDVLARVALKLLRRLAGRFDWATLRAALSCSSLFASGPYAAIFTRA